MKSGYVVCAMAAVAIGDAAASVASIDFVAGGVEAVAQSGVVRALAKGGQIDSGELVRTAPDGRAQLRFSDGALVSLQPDTQFRVDEYRLNTTRPEESKGFFSLVKGGLRTITGLIGRGNRDNYRVTTSVATIGIRGTEYSAVLKGPESGLVVATGEGAVEVCSSAGCLMLTSGQAGVVPGRGVEPRRTESRPPLPPPAPAPTGPTVYSTSDERTASGTVVPVSTPLVSGTGYALVLHSNTGPYSSGTAATGTATFGSASELSQWVGGTTYAGSNPDHVFSDGPIGWGHWSSMVKNGSSSYGHTHYVVGTLTPAGDLTALSGVTATYNLLGHTAPTSAAGVVTNAALTGSMTATFSGGTMSSGSMSLNVPIGSNVYALSGSLTSSGGAKFYGYPTCGLCGAGSSLEGFFAGSGASHAGFSYMFRDSSSTPITGAATFRR